MHRGRTFLILCLGFWLGLLVWAERINSVSVSGGQVQLDIVTETGKVYRLVYSTNLVEGVWSYEGTSFVAESALTTRVVYWTNDLCFFGVEDVTPTSPTNPPPPPPG